MVAREELYIEIYILNLFYLLDLCNQSLKMAFFRGQKKVEPRPDWSPLGV